MGSNIVKLHYSMGEYAGIAELIDHGGRFFYRRKGTTVEISEHEYEMVLKNPNLYYFSTALRVDCRAKRARNMGLGIDLPDGVGVTQADIDEAERTRYANRSCNSYTVTSHDALPRNETLEFAVLFLLEAPGDGRRAKNWIRVNVRYGYWQQWFWVEDSERKRKARFSSIGLADKFAERWVRSCWMDVYGGCDNPVNSVEDRCICGRTFCAEHHPNPQSEKCPKCRGRLKKRHLKDSFSSLHSPRGEEE